MNTLIQRFSFSAVSTWSVGPTSSFLHPGDVSRFSAMPGVLSESDTTSVWHSRVRPPCLPEQSHFPLARQFPLTRQFALAGQCWVTGHVCPDGQRLVTALRGLFIVLPRTRQFKRPTQDEAVGGGRPLVLSARHTPLIKLTFGKGTMNDANAGRLKDIVVPITRDHSSSRRWGR